MNPEVKAKWIAALRSGEYQQASGQLCSGTGFCNVGLLVELYIQETGKGRWIAGQPYVQFADEFGFVEATELPSAVMIWADIETAAPYARTPNGTVDLIDANDKGMSFSEIADIIEAHL